MSSERLVLRDGRPYTRNLVPGRRSYGERLHTMGGDEFREWDPHRSKLAAYLSLGGREMPIRDGSRVLYLGAASGTTASHVSDIVGDGQVFCVEFSQRSFRDLVRNCEGRGNMVPILADATRPGDFTFVVDRVDVVYQDVAQKNQADILLRNMGIFQARWGILVIKSRCEDVTKDPDEVFDRVVSKLRRAGKRILDVKRLEPYEKDHALVVVSS